MKDNLTLQWTLFILAGISVIVGIIAKAIPFAQPLYNPWSQP